MTDLATPSPGASPCLGVCRVNGRTGLCDGCFRTLKEIAGWGRLSLEDRETILAELPDREATHGDPTLMEKARARRHAYLKARNKLNDA